MENKNINLLVIAFLALILGVALIGQVATNTDATTSKLNVVNETIDISSVRLADEILSINESVELSIANAPAGWKQSDCPITNFVLYNQTEDAVTETTDYVFTASTGVLTLVNSTAYTDDGAIQVLNNTFADYTYCGDDYLNSTWGRSVLDMVSGFFALALLGVGIWLMYGVFRNEGIIGK